MSTVDMDEEGQLPASSNGSSLPEKSCVLSPEEIEKMELARTAVLDDVRHAFVSGQKFKRPPMFHQYANLVKEVLAKSTGPARDLLFEITEQHQQPSPMKRPQSAPQRHVFKMPNIVEENREELEAVLGMHLDCAMADRTQNGFLELMTTLKNQQMAGTRNQDVTKRITKIDETGEIQQQAPMIEKGVLTAMAETADVSQSSDRLGKGFECSLIDDENTIPPESSDNKDKRKTSISTETSTIEPQKNGTGTHAMRARVIARMNEALDAEEDDEDADIAGKFTQMLRKKVTEKRKALLKRRRIVAARYAQQQAYSSAKVTVKVNTEEEKAVLVNAKHTSYGPYHLKDALEFQEFFSHFFNDQMVHLHHHNESNTLEDTRITREMILDSPFAAALTQYSAPLQECRFNLGEGIAVVHVSRELERNLQKISGYLYDLENAENRSRHRSMLKQGYLNTQTRPEDSLSDANADFHYDADNRIIRFLKNSVENGGGLINCMRIGHRHRFCTVLEAAEVLSGEELSPRSLKSLSMIGRRRIAKKILELHQQIAHAMTLRLVFRLDLTTHFSVSLDQCLATVFPFAKYEERQRMFAALKIDGFVSRFAHFIKGEDDFNASNSTTEASPSSSSSSSHSASLNRQSSASSSSPRSQQSSSSSSSKSASSVNSAASKFRRPSASTAGTEHSTYRQPRERATEFSQRTQKPNMQTLPTSRPLQRQRTTNLLSSLPAQGNLIFGRVDKQWSGDCVALFRKCAEAFFGTVSLHGFIEILHSHGVCSNQTETQRLAVRQGIRPPHRDLTAWEAVKVMHIATRF